MKWLTVLVIGTFAVSGTVGDMKLSEITLVESGVERNYTATVYNVTNTELKWLVNGVDVAHAFIETMDGAVSELVWTEPDTVSTNESLYGFSDEVAGLNVTLTLTIKSEAGYGEVSLSIKGANATYQSPTEATATTSPGLAQTTSVGLSDTTESEGTTATAENAATPTAENSATPTAENSATPTPSDVSGASTSVAIESASDVTSASGSATLPNCDVGGQSCYEDTVFNCTREITMESCTVSFKCKNESYKEAEMTCQGKHACISPGVWGTACNKLCGQGCPLINNFSTIHLCDATDGTCLNNEIVGCADGWRGHGCAEPICTQDCNGGVCLAPNFCGNCPKHFESGVTCRNISLDGFTKGSLGTLAILAAVVIVLRVASECYERSKKKSD